MSQGNVAFELEIKMDIRRLLHATAITAAAMTLAWTLPGAAQVTANAAHAAQSGTLRLDNGRKWEPDGPHVILAEVVAGTEAMNGKSAVQDPRQGFAQVASAVDS